MLFTKQDINSESLKSFLRIHGEKESERLINGSLVAVYDKCKMVKKLKAHIHKHRDATRLKKHFKMWNDNLEILEALK